MYPHDRATTDPASRRPIIRGRLTQQPQPRSRTLPAADSEEAAPSDSEPGPAALPLPERLPAPARRRSAK